MQTHRLLLGVMGLGLAAMNIAQVTPRMRLKKAPVTYVLAGKGTVTLAEALPAISQVAELTPEGQAYAQAHGGPAGGKDFEAQCAELVSLGTIPASWRSQSSAYLTRGKLAYVMCKLLKIQPGLITGLFGTTERYAYRELIHQGLMAAGSDATYVTGSELVSVLSRSAMRLTKEPEPVLERSEYH